jgi:hypothetical protein
MMWSALCHERAETFANTIMYGRANADLLRRRILRAA